jgi:hypothetical protein
MIITIFLYNIIYIYTYFNMITIQTSAFPVLVLPGSPVGGDHDAGWLSSHPGAAGVDTFLLKTSPNPSVNFINDI